SVDIIVSHYLSLVFPLIAFIFISFGARRLTELVKARPSQAAVYTLAASFIIIGAGFTFFVFEGVPIHGLFQPTNRAVYDLPYWLLFFTIVVPYIFTWFIGLLAAY